MIVLVPQTRQQVLANIDRLSDEERAHLSQEWLARFMSLTTDDPWMTGFSVQDSSSQMVVGMCGFKGPPDSEATVEIAYGIDAEHRGRGYATAAAKALVAYAFTTERVRVVRAHTFSDENASARVLTKCGFRCVGQVVDPDDGRVWRWERHRGDGI